MSKGKRYVPTHVGGRAEQQYQPPGRKYGSHPQSIALDANSFRKQLRPRSHQNVQSCELDNSTEGAVRRSQGNVTPPKLRWNFRTDLLAERRDHHHYDNDEVEEHGHRLAPCVRSKLLFACQPRSCKEAEPNGDLKQEDQVGVEWRLHLRSCLLHDDFASHFRVNRAEVWIGSRLGKRERKPFIRVQRVGLE